METEKFPLFTVRIIGAFGRNFFMPLKILDGPLNSEAYCEFIDELTRNEAYKPSSLIVHDRATWHRSKRCQEMYETVNVKNCLLPACSPDLNPIENLWGLLTHKVFDNVKQYATYEQMCDAIQQAWADLSLRSPHPDTLISSVPSRLQRVIDAKGKWPER
jgi:transposase